MMTYRPIGGQDSAVRVRAGMGHSNQVTIYHSCCACNVQDLREGRGPWKGVGRGGWVGGDVLESSPKNSHHGRSHGCIFKRVRARMWLVLPSSKTAASRAFLTYAKNVISITISN